MFKNDLSNRANNATSCHPDIGPVKVDVEKYTIRKFLKIF
jgi:hypothetical protein